jgi:hypothetical protein
MIPKQFLMDWFIRSLLPTISKDVTMEGEDTEEQDILYSQHLKLIYSQYFIPYDIILHALGSSMDPYQPTPCPHDDGVVGYVSSIYVGYLVGKFG